MNSYEKFYAEMGALIHTQRRIKHLTQEQLASHLSLNRTSVTNIEKGKQKILVHTLIEIANCLEISLDSLLPSLPRQRPAKSIPVKTLLPKGSSKVQQDFFASAIRRSRNGEIRNANPTKAD